jgi:hypothetical protein
MKTLFMGCGCLTLIILLVGGGAAWFGWKTVQTMPPDAKREVLFPANRALIERIDAIISSTDNLDDLPKRLAESIDDQAVIYLRLEDLATGWKQDAFKRRVWDSQSITTWNGAGWGTLTGKFEKRDIRVIETRERTKKGYEIQYTLYLDHSAKIEK